VRGAQGFCFYNSVAVAAGVALAAGSVSKVAILDWDVHHGNGTQSIFYKDARVLYISLHRFGERWYPETGEIDEVGEGEGVGANLNVPWPADGMSDTDYISAMRLVVLPVLEAFAPGLLLISAGFDAAEGDAQGKMRVTPQGFAHMTELLMGALPTCPVALALEGGCVYSHSSMQATRQPNPAPRSRLTLATAARARAVRTDNAPVTSACCEVRALAAAPPPTACPLHASCPPAAPGVFAASATADAVLVSRARDGGVHGAG
jgi:hypothetical protein